MLKIFECSINQHSLVFMRHKIRQFILNLNQSEIAATLVSSCFSDITQAYFVNWPNQYLEIHLFLSPMQKKLNLGVSISCTEGNLELDHLSRCSRCKNNANKDTKNSLTLHNPLTGIYHLLKPEFIMQQQELLQRPEYDQLLAEVQANNQALNEARENLEHKVSERTQALLKAQLAAQNANEAKSLFLASMSHELRTPMNAILGLNHLLNTTQLNPKQKSYITKTQTSAENLLKILGRVDS